MFNITHFYAYKCVAQISPRTNSHTKIRLSKQGMKRVNTNQHGDHYVNIIIVVPKFLSSKQEALIKAYAELEENTPGTIRDISYKKDGKFNIFLVKPINFKFIL